ncbi:hypothetical protein AB8810_10905 [Xanthomonas sp. NCPPB 3005]|uniref:hypothetical protein n=1 Tax=Xanthomonas sp. NCPPB 3005 TaxID=3240913 RepID=UPI003513E8DE
MIEKLPPRPMRRMLQPTKDTIRDQLAAAREENAQLRAEIERMRSTWWRRLLNWRRAPKDFT